MKEFKFFPTPEFDSDKDSPRFYLLPNVPVTLDVIKTLLKIQDTEESVIFHICVAFTDVKTTGTTQINSKTTVDSAYLEDDYFFADCSDFELIFEALDKHKHFYTFIGLNYHHKPYPSYWFVDKL